MILSLNALANTWVTTMSFIVLQNTLFLGLIFLVLHIFRKTDASTRYTIGLLGVIKLLLPPFIPWKGSLFLTLNNASEIGPIQSVPGHTNIVQVSYTLTSLLFLVWLLVSMSYIITTLASSLSLYFRLQKKQKLLYSKNPLPIYVTNQIVSPLTLGLFPQCIYVPEWWQTMSETSRSSLLDHELAHIHRRDGWGQLLQTLVQAVYFFHPLVWLLNERMNEYREMACDDLAISASRVSPFHYSTDLLEAAENIVTPQWNYSSVSALIKRKHKILNRIAYQLQEGTMQMTPNKSRIAVFLLVLLIIPFSWYCSRAESPEPPKAEQTKLSVSEQPPPPPPPTPEEAVDYDTPPSPVGGFVDIQKNLIYPQTDFKSGIQGMVQVKCFIDKSGQVTETEIMKSLTDDCDKAAVNALKAVKWNPALKDGKPVGVWIAAPITFRIE